MKTIKFQLLLFTLFVLFGCQQDEMTSSVKKGSHSLVASIENSVSTSRTAVDENGRVTWVSTDAIGVFGPQTQNAKFESISSGSNVLFVGKMDSKNEKPTLAYYPYDENVSLNGNVLHSYLPSEYTYTGQSNAPMLGIKQMDGNFIFKHLGGLIRFTLAGGIPANADRFVVTSVGVNQPIAGKVSFATEGDNITMAIVSDEKQSISYDVSSIKDAEEYQHFFVPLPVGTYDKLEVSFYLKDAEEPVFTRSVSNLTVARTDMVSMPILDWKTGEQFVLGDKTKIISSELETRTRISSEKKTTLIVSNVEEENLPVLGEILLKGEVSKTFPEGFLGKVVSITEGMDGEYVIETEPVPLDVAFKSLYIEKTIDLYPESVSRADIEQDIEGFYVFTKKIEYEGDDDDFNASLEMSLGLKLDVVINVEAKVMYFALRDKIGLTGELSVKKSFEEEKKIPLGPAIPLPTITVTSPIIITPYVQLYAVLKASGEIEMCTELVYESRGRSWARYRSEAWEGDTDPRESEDSPWNAKGSIKMNGELFTGCSADFYGTFYGIQALAFGLEAEVGSRLFGDFNIETIQNENLGFVGINGGLNSRFELNSYFHINANIFEYELEAEFPLSKRTWGECFLYVFPTFTELQAKVNDEELQADISTEVTEKLLNKESQISLALIDSEGNIKEETEPVVYENPSINKTEQATPITTTFKKLEEKTEYQSYPIIQSPLLEDIVPEGKLELKYLSVSFKTKGSLREQLVQLYKNAGGENWTHKENWLSDKPIEEWYGIYENDGKYDIMLANNNLTGTFSLSSPDIQAVNVINNQIENICLAGCSEMLYFDADNNPLVTLDLSECKALKINSHYISNLENLKELKLKNCTQLTELRQIHSALEVLDLSGCENLKIFPSSSTEWEGLSFVDISGCKLIESLNILYDAQLKYLNISECTSLSDISSVDFDVLEEFHAKNCTNLKLSGTFPNIKVLDMENCSSIEHIYVEPQSGKITNINVKGCSSLFYLSCSDGQLTSIDLEGCDKLEALGCSGNQLSQLDLSKCPLLKDVMCGDNLLTDIDVTNNTELEKFWCDNNKLTSLDLTYNTQLKELYCDYNQLESLDFFSNPLMERIHCENNAISTIRLDKCGQLTYLTCRNNQLTSLNISQNKNLENLYCSNNKLSELDFTKLSNLSRFEGRNLNIKDVDVSNLKSLSYFSCTSDYLQSVNLEGCSSLENLHISGPITYFNHGMCNALETINISKTNLSSLDFNGCTALTDFTCRGNGKLASLNLSGCTSMIKLLCDDNPNLTDLTLMTFAPLEHVNFSDTKVSMEIPAFFPSGIYDFYYERRYTDYNKVWDSANNEWVVTYIDNGYGWWFPGEPERGYH